MPRASARLSYLTIEGKWTNTIHNQLNVAIRQAARAWLRAVITRVPVWSGMARGSLKFAEGFNGFLAQYLNVQVPINPDPRNVRENKNADVGGTMGRYSFTDAQHRYNFYFRSDVAHWIFHEVFARSTKVRQQITAPWKALEYGRAAYLASVRESLANLPKIRSALVRVTSKEGF